MASWTSFSPVGSTGVADSFGCFLIGDAPSATSTEADDRTGCKRRSFLASGCRDAAASASSNRFGFLFHLPYSRGCLARMWATNPVPRVEIVEQNGHCSFCDLSLQAAG